MNLGQTFNAADAPDTGFSPLPVGDYTAIITASEIRLSSKGDNMLDLKFEIVSDKGKGRQLFHILNLWNKGETAKKIAVAQLGQIQTAINKPTVADSSELHDKPMLISLGIQPAQNGYDAQNKITAFKPTTAQAPAAQAQGDSGLF